MYTATYSPEDNKLRIYAGGRLPTDVYERVKAAGFAWAPRQELFVAPAWSPEREDLLIELCGTVDDEDTSLVDRAEERAERFEQYSENRSADAAAAHKAVSAIADNIPLGQPILVGHHSERHARRDAEKIENGMRRAVRMWETSQYWTARAAGALRHAKYKELPSVRARRIKGLEAEVRKIQRSLAQREACRKIWEKVETLEQARIVCGRTEAGWLSVCKHPSLDQYLHPSDVLPFDDRSDYAKEHYPTWTLEQVKERAAEAYSVPGPDSGSSRWLAHLHNRIAYEKAMLGEAGGLASDRTTPEKGGACKCWASPRGGWSYITKVNKVSVSVEDNWGNGGANFRRVIPFDKLAALMTAAEVQAARDEGRLVESADRTGFFLTTDTPKPTPAADHGLKPSEFAPTAGEIGGSVFEAMRDTLKAGVQVVSAPQLFPTPPDLARRVVELAGIEAVHRVLEPSAGTGNLLRAIMEHCTCEKVAVEINPKLAALCQSLTPDRVLCADFLALNGSLGEFDRIVMNPPFENGADIKHIRHALEHLKPGGRLVAICANGPRQREAFMDEAEHWEDLPAGSFKESGTNVNTAIVVLTR
jgi:protein-L-isoaspartate O-methyltransferase